MHSPRSQPGFTLIELFLTITIFSVLLTMTIVVSFNAIARTNLRSSENALLQMIRRAQTQSQQNADEKQWGVHFDAGSDLIVLFSGDTYAARDGTGATFNVNENVVVSGTLYSKMAAAPAKGLVFKRFTGDPVEATFSGTIILTMYGSSRSMIVNRRGVVGR